MENYIVLKDGLWYVTKDIAVTYGNQVHFWNKGYCSANKIDISPSSTPYYHIFCEYGVAGNVYSNQIDRVLLAYATYSDQSYFRIISVDENGDMTPGNSFIQGDVPFTSIEGYYSVYVKKGNAPMPEGQDLSIASFKSKYNAFYMGGHKDISFPVFTEATYPVYIVATNRDTGKNAVVRMTYAQAIQSSAQNGYTNGFYSFYKARGGILSGSQEELYGTYDAFVCQVENIQNKSETFELVSNF